MQIYQSHDDGNLYYLNKFQAPSTLSLKVNFPELLVVNMNEQLVNGQRGIVQERGKDFVVVHFSEIKQVVKVKHYLFVKTDPVTKAVLAKRYQISLVLFFGITIHKV